MKRLTRSPLTWLASLCLMAGLYAPPAGAAVTSITVTGAGKGANAYRALAAVAEVVNRYSKTVRATNRESGGFVEGTRLVARNRVQIAMSSGPFVDFWQRKMKPFTRDKGPRNTLRGIGPSGDAIFQMAVLKDSGIKTYMDLKGKRVSLGPKGSNSLFMTTFILKELGIYDSVRKDNLRWSQAATNLVDGKLDAFGIPNPIGSPSILQAAEGSPIRILSVPDNVIQKFIDFSPGYYKEVVDPKNMYKGMEGQTFTSVVYMSMLVSNTKTPASVIYEVTRHVYNPKNRDLMVNIAVGWKTGLAAANNPKFIGLMKKGGMKLHPGAARYWKERGYKVN